MPYNDFICIREKILMLWIVICFFASPLHAGSGESLIVFTQNINSQVENHFQTSLLPKIIATTKIMNVELLLDDGARGFPPEVCITPLIVYQNHLGRSIYQGRTTSITRIKNFIRTSRRIPQGQKKQVLENIAVQNLGKTKIWSPVKIAPLAGTLPEGYDAKTFIRDSYRSIESGFTKFRIVKKATLGRCDRGFYMDFYPWCSKGGIFYLSLALYSQFHCKKPVFKMEGEKLRGLWKDRSDIFKKASLLMEKAVEKEIHNPIGGDGFDPLPVTASVNKWESLGYVLPKLPVQKNRIGLTSLVLPKKWHLSPNHREDIPMVQFRFPAPLDNYSGDVQRLSSEISFPDDNRISGMSGFIAAETFSVTMGEADLDLTIRDSMFLDSATFPQAVFRIKEVTGQGEFIEFARLSIANISGFFQLKGKEKFLSLPITIEPVIGDDGTPFLIITGGFAIDLRDFDIEGATGSVPEKYTLLFDINFVMSPKNNACLRRPAFKKLGK